MHRSVYVYLQMTPLVTTSHYDTCISPGLTTSSKEKRNCEKKDEIAENLGRDFRLRYAVDKLQVIISGVRSLNDSWFLSGGKMLCTLEHEIQLWIFFKSRGRWLITWRTEGWKLATKSWTAYRPHGVPIIKLTFTVEKEDGNQQIA